MLPNRTLTLAEDEHFEVEEVLKDTDESLVLLLNNGVHRVVYKWVHGPFWWRFPFLARLLVKNEVRALKKAQWVAWLQQLVKQVSSQAIVTEYVPGRTLGSLKGCDLPGDFFDLLHETLRKAHMCGIADLDFAHTDDILVTDDGKPVLIDFESSIVCNEYSWYIWKLIFQHVKDWNFRYLLKRKTRYFPEQISDEEKKIIGENHVVRNIWRWLWKMLKKFSKK